VFDHVGIHVSSLAESERFYTTVLGALGIELDPHSDVYREWQDFAISQSTDERPVTRNLHVGFAAPSRAAVDAFWQAGVDAGFASDGAPGERAYTDSYYGAFLLDPDGNSAEAVHRDGMRSDGNVDHVWFRVDDVAAARDFYTVVAPHGGFRLVTDTPERVGFTRDGAGGGAFSAVADGAPLTTGLHVAFMAGDTATVDAFHAAALAAGYRDNGAPGERPEYHAGYYGAFVLDPAGTNVESVFHAR
jgi:catechol 2,3-dioxygenase-like lactoylglutathione lyase family enzyme